MRDGDDGDRRGMALTGMSPGGRCSVDGEDDGGVGYRRWL